jgi:hypothetical protein
MHKKSQDMFSKEKSRQELRALKKIKRTAKRKITKNEKEREREKTNKIQEIKTEFFV